MEYDDQTRAWLIRAVDQRLHDNNPYQYGYVIPIQDQRVIATATGYAAHYSWDIPAADQEILIEHNGIQIVDFGFGKHVEAAKAWETVVGAFSTLLKRFSDREAIWIKRSSFLEAVNRIHSECAYDFEDAVMIRISYKAERINVTCADAALAFEFPIETTNQYEEVSVTIQSKFLRNALSGFDGQEVVWCRLLMKPDLLSIGRDGEKVAIIMGITFD